MNCTTNGHVSKTVVEQKYKAVLPVWLFLHDIQDQAIPVYGDGKSGCLWPEDGKGLTE